MATMWRRALHYLGLGPDDEYEDDGGGYDTDGRSDPLRGRVGPDVGFDDARPPLERSQPRVGDRPRPLAQDRWDEADDEGFGTGADLGAAVRPRPAPVDPGRPAPLAAAAPTPPPPAPDVAAVRPLPVGTTRPVPRTDAGVRTSGAVRAIAAVTKVSEVAPAGFNDAQQVGDRFRSGNPVVMDLDGVDRDLARRLIDFCSGLCYALGGRMERLEGQRYLMSPSGVEISAEERRRITGAS
jgi:cell division inhibitor SepF